MIVLIRRSMDGRSEDGSESDAMHAQGVDSISGENFLQAGAGVSGGHNGRPED
jgi:hypothetical protein